MKKENPGKKKYRRVAEASARADSTAGPPVPVIPVTDDIESLPVAPPSPPPEWLGPGMLIPLYTLVIVIGYLLFTRNPREWFTIPGNPFKIEQSLFTSINAATLTGFKQQSRNPADFNTGGKILTLILMLAGIEFSFLASGLAVVRIVRMKFSDYQVLLWSVVVTAVATTVGSVCLISHDRDFFDDIFLAVSAFGNCGLSTGPMPGPADLRCHLMLMPLALLGGLGIPVLMELGTWLKANIAGSFNDEDRTGVGPEEPRLSGYSRMVIRWTAGMYVACFLVLLPLRWCGPHGSTWPQALAGSSLQAINARSAGFMNEAVNDFPQALTAALVVVMLIGAAPAGTGGGVKVTAVAAVYHGIRNAFTGRPVRRIAGIAAVWIAAYLALVGLVTVALLIFEPEFQLDRTLFMAVSAVGNVGLAHNPIEVSPQGLYTLSFAMITGRVLPVLVLWWTVEKVPEAGIAVA